MEPKRFESEISKELRRRGLAYTRVSRAGLSAATITEGRLRVGEAKFEALLISDLPPVDPSVLRAVQNAVDAGLPVVWLGEFPERADGLVNAESRDALVNELVESLRGEVRLVATPSEIPVAMTDLGVLPSLSSTDPDGTDLSIVRRQVVDGDVYFLFNESYEARVERLRISGGFTRLSLLDAETGAPIPTSLDGDVLDVALDPVTGAVLFVQR